MLKGDTVLGCIKVVQNIDHYSKEVKFEKGSLRAGCAADLHIFSPSPLSCTSRGTADSGQRPFQSREIVSFSQTCQYFFRASICALTLTLVSLLLSGETGWAGSSLAPAAG